MDMRKAAVYAALVVGALVFLRVAPLFVAGFVRVVQTAAVTVGLSLFAVAVLYGGYRVLSRVRGTDERPSDERTDRIARLKRRYASGDLTQEEFEHRVEQELDRSTGFEADVSSSAGRDREQE